MGVIMYLRWRSSFGPSLRLLLTQSLHKRESFDLISDWLSRLTHGCTLDCCIWRQSCNWNSPEVRISRLSMSSDRGHDGTISSSSAFSPVLP